jgi:uncharacterized protein YhaN
VKLLRCYLHGFGKLAGLSYSFEPGLNLLFAPNEGGKSTLQHFLIGLLYGPLRSDAKVRRLDSWVEKYRPWSGSDYGGILWCESAAGRTLEIRRTFGKEDFRVDIRTATGEDVTDQYDRLKNGEVLFAASHLGLQKDLFESVAVIRESRTAEPAGLESVRDRIANLALSGHEDLSVQRSLRRLTQALESLGSERAPTKPFKRALDRLEGLQVEMRALTARRGEFESWLGERARLSDEVALLERELAGARHETAAARLRDAAQKIGTLEEILEETDSIRRQVVESGANAEFPAHRLEELNTLHGAKESVEQRLVEIRREMDHTLSRARQLEEEMRPLADYGSLFNSGEADRISEWFHRYLALSLQRDDAQRSLSSLRAEIHSMQGVLDTRPPLRDSTVDWERQARETAEAELAGSEKNAALAGSISRERAAISSAAARSRIMLVLGAVSVAAALLPVCSRSLPGFPELPGGAVLPFAAIFGTSALVLILVGWRYAFMVRALARSIQEMEIEQESLRESTREASVPLRRAMADSGFATLDEFLSAAREFRQIRLSLEHLSRQRQEVAAQYERLCVEAEEPYSNLRRSLSGVGLNFSPANLSGVVDSARTNLRRYRDLELRHRGNIDRAASLRAEEEALTAQVASKTAAILAILAEAGVGSLDAFRAACTAHQRLLKLRDREAHLQRELERVCEGMSVEEWKERQRQLAAAPELAWSPGSAPGNTPGQVPLLPYLPGVDEAEQEEKRIASQLAAAREEWARFSERLRHAFSGMRTVSEVEEDTGLVEAELENIRTNHRALETAIATIDSLSRLRQEGLAPQLNRAVELRFLPLSQDRYSEVRIDPDFNILARETSTNELREIESLSRGTQDQLYLALRFGVLDLISSADEPCPCLLDEPFAAYDRERISEAFRILSEEAVRRQLLLFTCREDVRDLAVACGASVIELALAGGSH